MSTWIKAAGAPDSVTYRAKLNWAFTTGERQEVEIKGTETAVKAIYDNLKLVAGSQPTYDTMEYDPGRGVARLKLSKVVDNSESQPGVDEAEYEFFPVEYSKRPQHHSHFASLTTDQVSAVLKAAENPNINETSSGFTALSLELFRHLRYGVDDLTESGYALRETKIVSRRTTLQASYDNVNRVVDPPDISAINAIIGVLPGGEWLKKAPTVTRVGRRWRITQEWWLAERWSVAYGGTWLEFVI